MFVCHDIRMMIIHLGLEAVKLLAALGPLMSIQFFQKLLVNLRVLLVFLHANMNRYFTSCC